MQHSTFQQGPERAILKPIKRRKNEKQTHRSEQPLVTSGYQALHFGSG
jgi:hypothetical protein